MQISAPQHPAVASDRRPPHLALTGSSCPALPMKSVRGALLRNVIWLAVEVSDAELQLTCVEVAEFACA